MKLPSVMKHNFSKVPSVDIQRSTFDRSHAVKTTFDAGYLVPFYVDEALPGDSFNLRSSMFARLATPIKPVMDNMYLDTFFFAVPYRLLWSNWAKFCGAETDPGDSNSFTLPVMTSFTVASGSLSDYLGLPISSGMAPVSLWHRAYNLIYNEWFRDQNLQDSATVDLGDGPDTVTNYTLRKRGKRHDYFTSCLPWPQKADSAVSFPIGSSAPVNYVASGTSTNPWLVKFANNDTLATSSSALDTNASAELKTSGGSQTYALDPQDRLVADLSNAVSATVNQVRESLAFQRMYELDARGGTRLQELILSHFGVHAGDARMQRPEYLGGGSSPINMHPVPQMTASPGTPTNTDSQGNLAAFGTASAQGHGFNKAFTEHCVILGLVNVRADLTYQQGVERMFSRSTRFDMYWPGLAHLGEQAVLNKEILFGNNSNDDLVFGYQEAWADYRYKPSRITGLFRSDAAGSLDVWHLSQQFSSLPTLGDTFIQDDPPIDRVIAVTTEPHFLFDAYMDLKCARPMPVNSIPSITGRF